MQNTENLIYHLQFTGRWVKRSGKKFFSCPVELIRYLAPILEDSFPEVCKRFPPKLAKQKVENSYVIREINTEILPNYLDFFSEKRITKKKIGFNDPADKENQTQV